MHKNQSLFNFKKEKKGEKKQELEGSTVNMSTECKPERNSAPCIKELGLSELFSAESFRVINDSGGAALLCTVEIPYTGYDASTVHAALSYS